MSATPSPTAALNAATAATWRPRLLTGWGRTAPTLSLVRPLERAEDLDEAFSAAGPRGLLARGLGRSYGDAAQNAGGHVLTTSAHASLRELDGSRGRVTVDAGVSIEALLGATLPRGWFVPVTPGTRWVSVGGAIASDIHGKNHHRDGSFCEHVEALTLHLPTGERRVVTAEGEPDVFWATAGGMGLTGVITAATLRLLPVETPLMTVDTERARDLDDALARMTARDDGYRYSVAWIDLLARGASLGRSVLTRGDHATRRAVAAARGRRPGDALPPPRLAAPRALPLGVVTRTGVRAFNEAWYRRAPREERGRLEAIAPFFYPLDGVRGWNRLYGPGGLVQYQLVVPFGREEALVRIVEQLSAARAPVLLAVLKRFGAQRGLLSFPLPGWTLALDLPARLPGLAPLLDRLDALVAAAGGRVYLAKDARLRPELLASMYPGLERWRELRARIDPARRMRSDLDRRLGLSAQAA